MKYALASCLVGSNEVVVWGRRLERRRKEKKHRRYKGLKMWGWENASHKAIMEDNVSMSIWDLIETFKGA